MPDQFHNKTKRADFEFIDCKHEDKPFRTAFLEGMTAAEKAIPCRYLYDERGSQLFDQICELPEYYPTRTETGILRDSARQIADLIGENAILIELGSGSSTKTRTLLDVLKSPAAYIPIDISAEHLEASASSIAQDYPGLRVIAMCANYSSDYDLPDVEGRRVGFFPGSTIGNLTRDGALQLLADWRKRLGPDSLMIIGVDLKKNKDQLEAAYDDAAGVTAEFITNILARANRELDADFNLNDFAYDSRYDEEAGRIEMRLRSTRDQTVRIGDQEIELAKGEAIHVENSHKYAVDEFEKLARSAGYEPVACHTDPDRLFSLHILAA